MADYSVIVAFTDGSEADGNLARAQALPLCPAIHMPQRYHLVHKGVPINGPKALGKHLTCIQCRDTVRMASGQLIILKNDLTDSDLTGRMLKSPMWKDEVRNKVRALRFTGFDAITHQRPGEPGQRCRCKMHGCIKPLALIGGDGGDGFFDPVGHITVVRPPLHYTSRGSSHRASTCLNKRLESDYATWTSLPTTGSALSMQKMSYRLTSYDA